MTRVSYIGNFSPPMSTENAYASSFESLGCEVVRCQQEVISAAGPAEFLRSDAANSDLVLYTRRHSPDALGPEWTDAWRALESAGVLTASVHLDVFWGLPEREEWIRSGDPLFTVGTCFTADGGSGRDWASAGVNHVWLPPAADLRGVNANQEGDPALDGQIVFVGSANYHPQWQHRFQMLNHLRTAWAGKFSEFGGSSPGGSMRGEPLDRIYASDCVVVGDHCFAGRRRNYWSDRVPETLGRRGFLLAVYSEGMGNWFKPGHDLGYWTLGDWSSLDAAIDKALSMTTYERRMRAADGRRTVKAAHTYPQRARTILQQVGLECPAG